MEIVHPVSSTPVGTARLEVNRAPGRTHIGDFPIPVTGARGRHPNSDLSGWASTGKGTAASDLWHKKAMALAPGFVFLLWIRDDAVACRPCGPNNVADALIYFQTQQAGV